MGSKAAFLRGQCLGMQHRAAAAVCYGFSYQAGVLFAEPLRRSHLARGDVGAKFGGSSIYCLPKSILV